MDKQLKISDDEIRERRMRNRYSAGSRSDGICAHSQSSASSPASSPESLSEVDSSDSEDFESLSEVDNSEESPGTTRAAEKEALQVAI